MENMERKNLELTYDQLEQATGGTTNGGSHEVFLPSDPLINDKDVSVEPIEEVTPSLP